MNTRVYGLLGLALTAVWLGACTTYLPAPVETRDGQSTPGATRSDAYQVQKGDTLYSIAWRYNLDYVRLGAWNRINPPYRINAGQWLTFPPPMDQTTAPNTPALTPKSAPDRPAVKPLTRTDTPRSKAAINTAGVRLRRETARQEGRQQSTDLKQRQGKLAWLWPARGAVVQTFRQDDNTRRGIRISGHLGQAVLAAEGGRVVYSGSGLVGYGQLIIIKHDNNYLSAYGFNKRLLVREGENVNKGDKVAEMGRSVDGKPLLHFEIRRRGGAVDPLRLLPRR